MKGPCIIAWFWVKFPKHLANIIQLHGAVRQRERRRDSERDGETERRRDSE